MRPFYERFPLTARALRVPIRLLLDYDLTPRRALMKWGAAACIVKYLFGL